MYGLLTQGDKKNEHLFVMQYMVSSMTKNATDCTHVWFVDLGASNYITRRSELFSDVKILERLGYVKTSDDSMHPIA